MKKITLLIFISGLLISNAFSQYSFTVDVSANHIGYDSKRELIYATVKGSDATYANSLIAINPYEGTIMKNIFVGSEPTEFVFTTDSNYLFIMFDEQPVVKKFDLNRFAIAQEINLGVDPYHGAYYGKSLAVLPDNDSVVIVSRKQKGVSPDFGGVAVYVNGVKLPWETQDHHGPEYLVNTQNDTLYAYENDFFTLKVDVDSGIVVLNETPDLDMVNAQYEEGLVFDEKGKVVNPTIPMQIGRFPMEDTYERFAHQADASKNKVFFTIVGGNDKDINFLSYNRTTFSKVTEYSIPNVISAEIEDPESKQLIRFGEKGLATIIEESWPFNEPKSMIEILNNSNFVDSLAPADTSKLTQLYVLDTVYTYEHITVYDTLDVFNYVTVYDTTHLSTTDTLIIHQTTTNVNGNIIRSEISLYPNPTSNYVNVEITNNNVIENYNIKLYNTLGELFFDSELTSNLLTIDVSSYAKGTYILILTDNHGRRIATKYMVVR